MALRKTRKTSKKTAARRRRAPMRRRRVGRRSYNVPDYASLSCKRTMAPVVGQPAVFNANTLYSLMNTQLADFPRAETVGSQYQHFRIKRIAVTFKPQFDTYSAGAGTTKPNLYWMIDKSGAIPTNVSLEGLKAMGARPKQLDEKNITISWRPSVLEAVMYAPGAPAASTASKYKISPWLSTQAGAEIPGAFVPSGIDHLGIYWYVDQLVASGAQYTCEVEVQFQFKKPLAPYNVGAPQAIKAVAATENDSADGVVGGGDGV